MSGIEFHIGSALVIDVDSERQGVNLFSQKLKSIVQIRFYISQPLGGSTKISGVFDAEKFPFLPSLPLVVVVVAAIFTVC